MNVDRGEAQISKVFDRGHYLLATTGVSRRKAASEALPVSGSKDRIRGASGDKKPPLQRVFPCRQPIPVRSIWSREYG
jgi:hypothetical protein